MDRIQISVVVSPTYGVEEKVQETENVSETSESLLLKKYFMKFEKKIVEPTQKEGFFRTTCKVKGK